MVDSRDDTYPLSKSGSSRAVGQRSTLMGLQGKQGESEPGFLCPLQPVLHAAARGSVCSRSLTVCVPSYSRYSLFFKLVYLF